MSAAPMAMAQAGQARAADFRGSGRRLALLIRPERARVTGVLALAMAAVTLSVFGPRLLGRATDLIVAGVFGPDRGIDFAALGRLLSWVLVLYTASAILSYLQGLLATSVVQRVAGGLRAQVAAKLTRLPLRYFDQRPRGEILSRATNDIDNIAQSLQQTLAQLITAVLTIAGVLAMMISISPLLAAVALVTVPVSLFTAARIARRARPRFAAQWMMTGQLNGQVEEIFTGHSVIRLLRREQAVEASFSRKNEDLYQASHRAQFIVGLIQPMAIFMGNLNYALVAVIGGLRVASGAISIGDVQAFIQYSRQFSQPVTQVAGLASLLQSAVASAERVFDLLDAPEQRPDQPLAEAAGWPGRITGDVAFEGVSFSYAADAPLIEHLSLSVRAGQTVAIVGRTGAGKTTLTNLLMRFYELDGGRIMLDGTDIASVPRESVRGAIGLVLQDPWLFAGTIAENIGYGAAEATREQIISAAKATHADQFVAALPAGYDTMIEDDGVNLSAGERQLITIARAFLSRPPVLVLDEATSSVDTRTELQVQRAMSALRAGHTSFVIAHRLSTIRDADLIVVLDEGAIAEQGRHEELLASGGAYARLYAAQFAGV